MTPQELVRIAKNINPEKLRSDPQAALEDAYIVWEAVRLVELEKISVPNYGQSRLTEPPDPREIEEPPAKSKWAKLKEDKHVGPQTALRDFQFFMKHTNLSVIEVAKKLGVRTSTIYSWIKDKHVLKADSNAKIGAFLTDEGYYE